MFNMFMIDRSTKAIVRIIAMSERINDVQSEMLRKKYDLRISPMHPNDA